MKHPSILVRRPRESELSLVRRLFLDMLREIPYYHAIAKQDEARKYSLSNLVTRVRKDRNSIVCAVNSSGSILGFTINHFDDYTIWLEWIVVSRSARNKGVGTLLFKDLFRMSRLHGCHKVWSDCRTNNEPSKALLKKTGFKKIAEIKNHWYRQDFILWERFV